MSELARCTGSPIIRARRFSRLSTESGSIDLSDSESPLNSLIEEVKARRLSLEKEAKNDDKTFGAKKSVKFDVDYSKSLNKKENMTVFSNGIDWQHKKFMAVA